MHEMRKKEWENMGFVYLFWERVFCFLEKILPFTLLRKYVFKKTKQLPDKWVVFNVLFSIIGALTIYHVSWFSLEKVIAVYAIIRVFEIIIYQINVLLFHPYRTIVKSGKRNYKLQNPYRSVVLLAHNILEIIFWFSCVTQYIYDNNQPFIEMIMDNAIRIFTFTYEKVPTAPVLLQYIIFIEVASGMILVLISLAKFIGELPHGHISIKVRD